MEKDIIENVTVLNSRVSLPNFIEKIVKEKEDDESFYVLDLQVLVQQNNLWKKKLPTIKPYYAVKCNDTMPVLEVLHALGTGFDCASTNEMKKVLEAGATSDDIIFANPSKVISHLEFAREHEISLMTFDSKCELDKVKKYYPEARLILRIKAEAEHCVISLGGKFGCEPAEADELLKYSKNLNLNVIGISFHVGTGCQEPKAYSRAIHLATDLIDKVKKFDIIIKYLDIGGGFTGDSDEMFEKTANSIDEALEIEKDRLKDVKVIAEPGRYFACKAFTLATNITSIKKCQSYNIYCINNSIYGAFNCAYTENAVMVPVPLKKKKGRQFRSIIWGQTEELHDIINKECWLPEMKVGDWLYFENMGAYSTVLSVRFEGFAIPKIFPVINEGEWIRLQIMLSSKKE